MKNLFISLGVSWTLFYIFVGGSIYFSSNLVRAQAPFPRNDEPIVAQVYFVNQAELNRLASELDIWTVVHDENYAVALIYPEQMKLLREEGYQIQLDENGMSRLHKLRHQVNAQANGIPGFPCYRTVEETYTDLAKLATDHPDLAEWLDVGDSWNKLYADEMDGYDLYTLVLTNRNISIPKPKLLLLAAIHARELATAELVTRFAEYLVANYDTDADITWLLDYAEIHIMPLGNPDGRKLAEQKQLWRKNTNTTDGCIVPSTGEPWFPFYGVDLNRNSSFKWNQCQGSNCSSGAACNITFRGTAPASEPETQAIQSYVSSIFPDRRAITDTYPAPDDTDGILISIHSFSQLVLFPWGWTDTASPNHAQLQTLGRKFGYFTDYVTCQAGAPNCLYQTDGTTDDWSYGELGIASYTFELGTEFFQACSFFEEQIVDKNFAALLYAFKAVYLPYQQPSGPDALQVTVSPTLVLSGTQVLLRATIDDTRYDSNGKGVEPVQHITAARYTINAPSWIIETMTEPLTGTIPMTGAYLMTAADGTFDATSESVQALIDTIDWPVGRYTLFIEGQDAHGNWGVPSATFLRVVKSSFGFTTSIDSGTTSPFIGSQAVYTISITNTGTLSDVFNIGLVGNEWPIAGPSSIGPLYPMEKDTFTVSVSIPTTATFGMTNTLSISVTSQTSHTVQAIYPLVIEAQPLEFYFPLVGYQAAERFRIVTHWPLSD